VSVLEVPADATAGAFALSIARREAVRLVTSRAYTADEMTGILARLG
jgi:uncharacterized protein with GYD domain